MSPPPPLARMRGESSQLACSGACRPKAGRIIVDDERFDTLSRVLGEGATRRWVLNTLLISAGAALGLNAADVAEAKKKKKGKRKGKNGAAQPLSTPPPPPPPPGPPPGRPNPPEPPDLSVVSVCEGGLDPCEGVCVNGKCCIGNCEGKFCADDGCGTPCGSCPQGRFCASNDQCLCISGAPCGGTLCCASGLTCVEEQGQESKCCRTACPPSGCGTYRDTCSGQPLECGACSGSRVCSNPENGGICQGGSSCRRGDVNAEIFGCDG
jgi:hypothetical protein